MDVRIAVPYARCEKGSFTELVIHARKEEGVSAATLRVGGVKQRFSKHATYRWETSGNFRNIALCKR